MIWQQHVPVARYKDRKFSVSNDFLTPGTLKVSGMGAQDLAMLRSEVSNIRSSVQVLHLMAKEASLVLQLLVIFLLRT